MMKEPRNINAEDFLRSNRDSALRLSENTACRQKGKGRNNNGYSKKDIVAVIDHLVEKRIDITNDYNDYIAVGFALKDCFGEEGREHFHRLCSLCPKYERSDVDAKYDNILASNPPVDGDAITVGTLLMMAAKNGVTIDGATNNVIKAIEYIKAKYKFRDNVITGRIEKLVSAEGEEENWEVVVEKDFDTLYVEARKAGIKINKTEFLSVIKSADVSPVFNPIDYYFRNIPPYVDSMSGAIDDIFYHLILASDEDVELCHIMFRKWFIGCVAKWNGIDQSMQEILMLIGKQNTGKTYFVRNLLADALQDYYDTVLPKEDFRDKDRKLTLSEKLLLNLDEWLLVNKSTFTIIKAITSLVKTSIRDSYAHFREVRKCLAAIAMTSNDDKPLGERAGNRRMLGINVIGTVNFNEHPLRLEDAYAEALHIIRAGWNYHFTQDEIDRISAHNERFTEISPTEAAIEQFYRIPRPGEAGKAVFVGDIIMHLQIMKADVSSFSPEEVGKTMTRLGYMKKASNGRTRYYVWEKTIDEIKAEERTVGEEIWKEIQAKEDTGALKESFCSDLFDDNFTDSDADERPF